MGYKEETEELRVLLVTNTLSINGGSESIVVNIFNTLKRRQGVKVKLLTLKSCNSPDGFENPALKTALLNDPDFTDCDCSVYLSILKPNRVNIDGFTAIVNSFKPHVIHSHLFISELVAHEVVFPGIKYFTHCHDNMPQLRKLSLQTFIHKSRFTDFFEKQHLLRRYIQCNNKFIAVSETTKQFFEDVLPSKLKKNVLLLQNAIVIRNFENNQAERSLNSIRIVNAGSFIPVKNQKLLVAITRLLLQRGRNVYVEMLGGGPEYEMIKKQVAAEGLSNYISMPGPVVDVRGYYSNANIYVHTCTNEAFGLVFLEAMASGLPVVSLDAGGNRGLVNNGVTGFMITEENPALFADAIEKIIDDRELYLAMSASAKQFVKTYDFEDYVDKLVKLYKHN